MNIRSALLFGFLTVFAGRCLAQGPVSVNPVTGTANVTIPVYTLNSGQVSAPIYVQYTATGVKTWDVEGTAGVGWQLQAGGQISRMVRGLPDDCTKDSTGASRLGWMSTANSGATYAATFVPQNINNFSTGCSEETADISNINTNMPYTDDTEPDLFYVNAPGLSCELVYDRVTAAFHTISYQDLSIQFTIVTAVGNHTGNITSFTITNDKGITYVFAAPEMVTEQTVTTGYGSYFTTKVQQYQNRIKYADAWNLVSITDPYGNGINFTYTIAPVRNSSVPLNLFVGGSMYSTTEYTVNQATTPQVLSTMGTFNAIFLSPAQLNFTWSTATGAGYSGQTFISQVTGFGHTFQFNYNAVVSTNSTSNFTRFFLSNFTDTGCGTPVNYSFGYLGQTGSGPYYTTLPDSASRLMDYWGYYSSSGGAGGSDPAIAVLNPAISYYPRYAINPSGSPGADYSYTTIGNDPMPVVPATVVVGSLNQVTYPQGASTTLLYESNDYYDVPSESTIQGGGIRVKQITTTTGMGNDIVKNYTYLIPTGVINAGFSSGQPVTLPQYAFAIPYNGTATGPALYAASTAISEYDLSDEDHSILYSYVTVTQTGAGSTLNYYNNPNTYFTAAFGTINDVARYTCSNSYGPMANFSYSYPFVPNPNVDYERGLLIKSTNFNDAGAEVSESNYTYQTPYTSPAQITAFRGDDQGPYGIIAKGYNIYPVYYNVGQLTSSVNTIVYDSQGLNQTQSSTVNYTYGSSYHRLVTQQQALNSDGSTVTTYISYAKDFPNAANVSNANIAAIYHLQQQNINEPVETYRTFTPSGGSPATTDASLTVFRDTTIGTVKVIPSKQYKWISPGGATTFTPLVVTSSAFTKSAGYFDTQNFDIYDKTGFPQTVDDNNRHMQTTILDHFSGHPTAVFTNAAYNQVAFTDLDTDPSSPLSCSFNTTGTGGFTPTTSHAGNAYGLGTTQTVHAPSISKNSLAQNYIFSIWTSAATAGTLTLSTGGAISYPGGNVWTYNEVAIPASSLASPIVFSFTSSQPVSIDDLLLYPDVATAATATFDPVNHFKLDETNTNGVSAYYTHDQWGRLTFQFDQDKNIVLAKSYITPGNITDFNPGISISPSSGITTSTTVNFSPTNYGDLCTSPANVYIWNFGDGTPNVTTTSSAAQPHIYASGGSYPYSLTVNSNYFPSKTASGTVNVGAVANVPLHYNNYCSSLGDILSVTFSQGGVQKYSFTVGQLPTATVLPGTYTVAVLMNNHDIQYNSLGNGAGYQSVQLLGTSASLCLNFVSAGNYTFNYYNVNLYNSTGLTFQVNITSCPGGSGNGGGE